MRAPDVRVRPDKYLQPLREPAQPRAASTVLLLRDGPAGPEVLMTRRSMKASFLPGAYVFPGGTVDAADRSPTVRQAGAVRADQDDDTVAHAAAAVREAFEELGILLARPANGKPDEALVARIAQGIPRDAGDDFHRLVTQAGLVLALDQVHWLSRWVTDPDLPKRFDTWFFVGRAPQHQEPMADNGEQFEPTWIAAAEALERHARGTFDIIFPTIRTLRWLARHKDVDAILSEVAQAPGAWVSRPRGGLNKGVLTRYSEDELPYGELELVTPDGRPDHELGWQHERPVPLLRHVRRLTAPNPGRMTGPGTNTWIIGERGDYIVIDPGPDEPAHLRRIADAVGDGLSAIICTHAHPDHAPGAAPLKAMTGGRAPILGQSTGPFFDPKWKFVPERELVDGERLKVGDSTLRVVHTPGHVSNHICLLLEEDGLLFSGDHILSGSTTVITPPDGDMRDYVTALHRLLDEPFDFILPAHGYVISDGKREVRRLIAHRMGREEKVVKALRTAGGPATVDELVLTAYDDVDEGIRPVAKRSLTAHLMKLRDDGRVVHQGDTWALQD